MIDNLVALNILLIIHIIFGSCALLSDFGSIFSNKGGVWHRRFGKIFFYSMTGVFITAIPLAIARHNMFILLVAILSYYLTFSGWRYARNRNGFS